MFCNYSRKYVQLHSAVVKHTALLVAFAAIQSSDSLAQTLIDPANIDEIVESMSLEEKVRLVVGVGMDLKGDEEVFGTQPVAGEIAGKVEGAAGATQRIPRLNIPSIVLADGPAGLRISPIREGEEHTYYCTAFPIGTSLASTWDMSLLEEVGRSIGNEVKEYGVDIWLAPALNVQRNPLGGRNFEYYSEDPVLSGKTAAAVVKGIQSNGVGTSVKHFAVNNQETSRMSVDAVLSQRALREIYLRGFEIAVKESKPWTVMSSYNYINGTYASESEELLTRILREEWGFEGFVMTDWFAGKDAVKQIHAGNDLLMPGRRGEIRSITKALKKGTLADVVIDRNVKNILKIIARTPSNMGYIYSNQPDLVGHAKVSRRAAAEGSILLKNTDAALPVKKDAKVALFGNHAYATLLGGTGSGEVNEAYTISINQGLDAASIHLDTDLNAAYKAYIRLCNISNPERKNVLMPGKVFDELTISEDIAAFTAKHNDIAVITIGRVAGENRERDLETQFYLSSVEELMIERVSTAFHKRKKPVVVILNIDAVIDVASWRDSVDAILLPWLPGQEGGNAIADILTGKVNPSAKLSSSIPMKYEDVPTSEFFPNSSDFKEWPKAVHKDGIYVGYRYYDTFDVEPAYPFGHGLSYTRFGYSNLSIISGKSEECWRIQLDLTNIGLVQGKEVVQVYIHAPAVTMHKPEQELKAFAKTIELKPNDSQTIVLDLDMRDLASFDSLKSAWVVESGRYAIRVGSSSRDIRLVSYLEILEEVVVEQCQDVMAPVATFEELKSVLEIRE